VSQFVKAQTIDVLCQEHRYRIPGKRETYSEYNEAWQDALDRSERAIGNLPPAQPEWNNHTVACLLAELFDDTCACNYNDIDEWLPEKCEVSDACPNPVGVACWEQYLKHRAERRTDERTD
jgi:hypothetical protein